MKLARLLILSTLAWPIASLASAQTPHAHDEPTAEPIAIGTVIPMRDHRMLGVDGQRVSIGSVAGQRGTLVVFTCNHCPWAQAWESRIVALGNAARGRGVGVIAINSNDPSEHADDAYAPMQERSRTAGMQFPYVVDDTSNVARAFGATRTPEVFLFDGRGRLAYHGAVDDNAHEPASVQQHYLRDAIDALVAGRAITSATTRSIGCTIKFRDAAAAPAAPARGTRRR
ncbi:MAG: thioredoxin family protein [Sandaracinaceae bacterium]